MAPADLPLLDPFKLYHPPFFLLISFKPSYPTFSSSNTNPSHSALLGEAALLAASATHNFHLSFHLSFSISRNNKEPKVLSMAEVQRHLSKSSSSSSFEESEDELQHMPLEPPPWQKRKRLSKQLSMCETRRDIAWEKRRRQILRQERRRNGVNDSCDDLTDEDLNELKGSIELGFGFNEEDGQTLCNTLPALDLYFAVNRQLSFSSPTSTPQSLGDRSSSFGSTRSDSDSWKICSPGENPEQVKTKLRHWAQAVACSVLQSF